MGRLHYTCLLAVLLDALLAGAMEESAAIKSISSAIIVSKAVPAIVGVPLNMSCSSGKLPLESCRWERRPSPNGKRYVITVRDSPKNGTILQDNLNCNCAYMYTGVGLEHGDCSISINNVTEFHFAKWECTLIGTNHRDSWFGNLNITKLKTDKPYFKNTSLINEIVYNETSPEHTDVTCCVDADRSHSPINIKLQLENETKTTTNTSFDDVPSQFSEKSSDSSVRAEQLCRRSRYLFIPTDNGKRLACIVTYTTQSHKHNEISYFRVGVKYGSILPNEKYTQEITKNNSLLINVTFMANPQPNVTWHLKYDPASGTSFEIRKDHVKYKTKLQRLHGDNYRSTLEIVDLQPEDYRREFLLELTNPLGRNDVFVQLVNPVADNESGTYWIPIITGLGIIVLLVLVATGVFIVIRRRIKASGKYVPAQVTYSAKTENN